MLSKNQILSSHGYNMPSLIQAIDKLLAKETFANLEKASQELSYRYRNPKDRKDSLPFMYNTFHRKAYLLTRMPATYAAISRVLAELSPFEGRYSVLDVGAGPGTAMWAAREKIQYSLSFTLVEQDREMIGLGKQLASFSGDNLLNSAKWICESMLTYAPDKEYDIVILSYAIGELEESAIQQAVDKFWKAAKKFLVIIEPGTMSGFERIRLIRQNLLERNGFIVAPCPHSKKCPMPEGDWCHFSQRLERSALHKRAKEGSLGYEDEKFSYIIMAKDGPCRKSGDRILRHPIKHTGHVGLTVCSEGGTMDRITISRKSGEEYKKARKAEWGDKLPLNL